VDTLFLISQPFSTERFFMSRRIFQSTLLPLLLISTGSPAGAAQEEPLLFSAQEESVFFLVRHTERTDDEPDVAHSDDPHLSEAGQVRAALLAKMLKDAGLTHIHSSDYVRTRETAELTAAATGIDVDLYDAAEIPALALQLKSMQGRHLVVGHSNTTWDLVEALGGDPGPPIESMEYDRLYMVIMGSAGVRTVLLRFGTPFGGSPLPSS
jgi:probable phosphoglycerate mutase